MKQMRKTSLILVGFLSLFCFLTVNPSYAQDEDIIDAEKHEYKEFTMESLAELYWRLDRPDIENREDIDNFMKITQCSLHSEYFQNEFEWQQIRDAAKAYILENKKDFPVRFEFMQPLRLGEYDLNKQQFEIQDKYQLKGTRRFEVVVQESGQKICDDSKQIPGYPGSIGIQFSRPVALTDIPVKKDLAEEYIAEKQEQFKNLNYIYQTPDQLMALRNAYIVMKVKFFSSQGLAKNQDGNQLPLLLATLERIEVYADQDKKTLLMSKNMTRRKRAALPSLAKTQQTPEEAAQESKEPPEGDSLKEE